MRIDLDSEATDLGSLPRFQRALLQAQQLRHLALWLLGIAAAILALLLLPRLGRGSEWRPLLAADEAALLLLLAGVQSAYRVARWRRRAQDSSLRNGPARENAGDAAGSLTRWRRWLRSARSLARQFLLSEAVCVAGLALLALLLIVWTWSPQSSPADLGQGGIAGAGGSLAAAFGCLVLERYFASSSTAEWPEARPVAQLSRVLIACLLLSGACLLFSAPGRPWMTKLPQLAGLLPAAVALELLLRAALSLFVPIRTGLEPRLLANSFAAGLLRWQRHPLQTLQDGLHSRFGIDLRQSWAFAEMRRVFMPVLLLMAALGWSLSGVREIPLDGRGISERFGKPVKVLGPGLHAGLPWPLGMLRPVENGVVHELAAGQSADDKSDNDIGHAEGPAPESANRLWDASHASENSQVIASIANDRQSFQMVNMDIRLIYRIGLTDQAAIDASYKGADLPALIRSTANRVLVRDFASRTLDDVLGARRAALASDITQAVQSQLDDLASGVEILAVVIEAIHPPAGAANAYHAVQAAQITAQALVARERGYAAQQTNAAQMEASIGHDKASAAAREIEAGAEATQLRFAAEQDAYRSAGSAFLLERYLAGLSKGLAGAKLLIVDHRIGTGAAPVVDLRAFTPLLGSGAAGKAEQ